MFLQQAVLCSLERWREGEATFQAVCSATYLPVILPSLANYHHLYLCHFHLDLYSYLDLKPPINPSFLPAMRRLPLLEKFLSLSYLTVQAIIETVLYYRSLTVLLYNRPCVLVICTWSSECSNEEGDISQVDKIPPGQPLSWSRLIIRGSCSTVLKLTSRHSHSRHGRKY